MRLLKTIVLLMTAFVALAQPIPPPVIYPITVVKGGTGGTTAPDDNLMIGSGTAWTRTTIPDCPDTGGNHLNYVQSTNSLSCGTSGGGAGGYSGQYLWGDASAGDLTISSGTTTVTQHQEINYDTITITGTASLETARRVIRARVCDLSNAPANAITSSAPQSSGTAATTVTADAQTSLPRGSTTGAGGQSLTGLPGGNAATVASPLAWLYPHQLTPLSGAGGSGGSGQSGAGGNGASAASATTTYYPISAPVFASTPGQWSHQTMGTATSGGSLVRMTTGPSGGGGGGGGGSSSGGNLSGGISGSGGRAADALVLFCGELIVGDGTAAGAISAIGGGGADGVAPATSLNGGGGGGGGGGAGGYLQIVVGTLTGSKAGAVVATGGDGGDGGTGTGTGTDGTGGQGGGGGKIIIYRFDTDALTNVLGAAGGAATGTAGGVGGAATADL